MSSHRGKLILVVAPSGSGKNTLIHFAERVLPNLPRLVTCTTRAPRPGEVEGVDYHFLTPEAFDAAIERGEFLEWATYGEHRYGTLKATIERYLATGALLLATIDVQGVREVLSLLPESEVATIYIDAGHWESLAARISARAPISDTELEHRRVRFEDEATFKPEATHIIENHDGQLDKAQQAFVTLIKSLQEEVAAR